MSRRLQVGDAVVHRGDRVDWYRDPVAIHRATRVEEVRPCLDAVESAVASGLRAVGYVAYEAAPAFDRALACHEFMEAPLVWFGCYEGAHEVEVGTLPHGGCGVAAWRPRVERAEYIRHMARLKELIAAGDTYQVNYTFPLSSSFQGDVLAWFLDLAAGQRGQYSTLIHEGGWSVVSVSPELFFELDGWHVGTKPMKGTWRRGRWCDEDAQCREALWSSEKDRAENVMIVDLIRNDLGRIGEVGTVRVERLFDVERYPTVWQMTSTIGAETKAGVPEIFAALFPSGSVTGAPKVRTMEIIRELEPEPRGVYCGAVGVWDGVDRARFSVAIRTAFVNHDTGAVRYSVGSGVTWDSAAEAEYEECLLKAEVARSGGGAFELLETLRWDGTYHLLDEHLERLRASAAYFDVPLDESSVQEALDRVVGDASPLPHRVRLLVALDGAVRVERFELDERTRFRVGFATGPVDTGNIFLYHKTTKRAMYEEARATRPECDDVLLWNERGEVTESTIANVVMRFDGVWYTPPVSCGLLAGTFRARLLREGTIQERVISRNDVHRAEEVRLINSLRGWMDVEWSDQRVEDHAGCD